jgi:hypothetical protein
LVAGATFSVLATTQPPTLLRGRIAAGVLTAGPGNATLTLALSGATPLEIPLGGVRVKASVTADGITDGILAGAVRNADMQTTVLPGVYQIIAGVVARDCSTASGFGVPPNNCCQPGSVGKVLIEDLFQPNASTRTCVISLQEFETNPFVGTLLAPDLQLFDANGNYAPVSGPGKNPDSVSFGVGFGAVGGVSFTLPPEAAAQANQ